MEYHPKKDASWVQTKKGIYETGEDFYQQSGGIFDTSAHYEKMFGK